MIQYSSVQRLAEALRRAEKAHGKFEKNLGHRDKDWPVWYAEYMQREQTSSTMSSSGFHGQ